MSVAHQMHMKSHETRFGKLGELQTEPQKRALNKENRKLDRELSAEQKARRDEAIKQITKV